MQRPNRRVALICGLIIAALAAGAAPSTFAHGRDAERRPRTGAHRLPEAAARASTGPLSQFPGHGPCDETFCWTPGEPTVSVGAKYIVETVNTAATVYTKAGAQVAAFNFESLWGSGVEDCLDVRGIYIPSDERFAISCTGAETPTSPMHFAISKTSDPAEGWYTYSAPNTESLDQDKIVATSDKFIVAGNGSSEQNREQLYVYNLRELAEGAAKPQLSTLALVKSNIYQGAVEETASANAYFVSWYPGGSLYVATVSGNPAEHNVKAVETAVKVKAGDFPAPIEPAVPGGQIGGGALDGRIYSAVYETETGGTPVIAFSSARRCAGRDCVSVGKLSLAASKPTLLSYTLIGEPGWDYTYGAVALNGAGEEFVSYSRSNAAAPVGAAVAGPGFDVTLQPGEVGTSTCSPEQSGPCNERWGDYLGAAIDPSEPAATWVAGLYQASSGTYGWGTVVAKASAGAFALATATTGAASAVTGTGATIAGTVNPNGQPTSYHVDYGTSTGYEAASAEVPAGSGNAPVNVSVPVSSLRPGATYHYRVVATSAAGNAVGADRTFKTKPPKITAVKFTGTPASPTVTITGTNFGPAPPAEPEGALGCVAGDTSHDYGTSLMFTDVTRGWTAGETGDCIGLVLVSYSPTEIVYSFGADYANYPAVGAGDSYSLNVYSAKKTGSVAYG